MAKYIIKNGNLYNADELYHAKFKYIKREWIKGKWRYWYEDSKIKKTATKVTDTAKGAATKIKDNVKDKLGYDEKQKVTDAKKKVDATKKTVETTKKQLDVIKSNSAEDKRAQKTMVKNATAKVETATKEVDKATKAVDKAIEEYSKTPIAKIENLKKELSNLGKREPSIYKVLTEEEKKAHNEQAAKDKAAKEREETFARLDKEGKLHETPTYQPIDAFEDLPRKYSSRDEDMAAVNPNYNPYDYDYSYNCQRCTFAYEMRRRGYDVEAVAATGRNNITMYAEGLPSYYVGADKMVNPLTMMLKNKSLYPTSRMVEKELLSHGEGARGHITTNWKQGGAHVMNWEVENGKVVIRDAQTNTASNLDYYWEYMDPFTVRYLRTDNLDLKPEVLKFVKRKER